uniref:eRF1/Pelota-like N-terminal domain-containing protein n=1 Tax=Moniliophthora roreri TaxID=221103 RepID=A0A0W0FS17_MONRR
MSQEPNVVEQNIQTWKIKSLDSVRGGYLHCCSYSCTQGVFRIDPLKEQIYRGSAFNIKSRINRLSVLAAITTTQQRLELYNRVPPNGLALFIGTILNDEGKEKKVAFNYEPLKLVNRHSISLGSRKSIAYRSEHI